MLYTVLLMNESSCIILNWNVRGLNGGARRQVVRDMASDHHAKIVCLQETKLQAVSDLTISETLGNQFVGGYAVLPAEGTSGGIIIACSVDEFILQDVVVGNYMISANVMNRADGTSFSLTGVYGPQLDAEKEDFLSELWSLRPAMLPQWVVLGDFNLIYRASQKNNNRINFRMMNRFKSTLDTLDLRELQLHGRRFTWSSGTAEPTLTKIDHLFYTEQWELEHPNCYLQALSSSMSDHSPLLLSYLPRRQKQKAFRFETFWTRLPNFLEVVQQSWGRGVHSGNKIRVLHIKLSRLAKALIRWSKQHVMALKLKVEIATEVVALLDQAQECRPLSDAELSLRKTAKDRILGFTALRRIKIRQRSRLTWVKLGDANNRLFHLRANSRRRKNFIPALTVHWRTYTRHHDKANQLFSHFSSIFGTRTERAAALNWEHLQITGQDLSHLDESITEEEVRVAVFSAPSEKAPGPDGYTGLFYKIAWPIIKDEIMQAIQQLYCLRANNCSLVNSANVILLPKSDAATCPSDFRPISLMHSVAKILTKVLANRLAPLLSSLVSLVRVLSSKGGVFKTISSTYRGRSIIFIDRKRQCYFSSLILPKLSTVSGGNICWRCCSAWVSVSDGGTCFACFGHAQHLESS